MSGDAASYEMDLSANDSTLIVRLRGRLTTEAGRHLRDVVWAAKRCGVPVEVDLPQVSGRIRA